MPGGGDCGGWVAAKGAKSPVQGMIIYLAMTGQTPRQIHDYMVGEGYVLDPPRELIVRDESGAVIFAGLGKVDPPETEKEKEA